MTHLVCHRAKVVRPWTPNCRAIIPQERERETGSPPATPFFSPATVNNDTVQLPTPHTKVFVPGPAGRIGINFSDEG